MKNFKDSFGLSTALIAAVFLLSGCSDDDSDSSDVVTISFPTAGSEVAAFTIDTSGADGSKSIGGAGGTGGNITVLLNEGLEGRLEILDNGVADASFSTPTMTIDTGTTGETISVDTVVSVDPGDPGVDTFYVISGDQHLYKSNGAAPLSEISEIVSGLTIDATKTLTIELNNGTVGDLAFTDDVEINGTVTAVANGAQVGDVSLMAKNIVIGSTGVVTTAGTDTTVFGGGSISLSADYVITNAGTVNSSGFADATIDGGNAGSVSLTSGTRTYNTGSISSMGGDGDGTGMDGGDGANVSINTMYGDLNNSGAINTKGGDADVFAGNAGTITLSVNNLGNLHNSGNFTANGGTSTTVNGADGNAIMLSTNGGDLINSGNLTTMGGIADDGSVGGDGGNISISSDWGDFESMPGNIIVSGNLNTAGGGNVADAAGGGIGGKGGSITIAGNNSNSGGRAAPQLVGLWGYTSLTSNGGNGESGQTAGNISISTATNKKNINIGSNIEWRSSGDIINEVALNARGGNSTSTVNANVTGGAGGEIEIRALNNTDVIGDPQTVTNSGNIVTSSGTNHEHTAGVRASGLVTLDATGGVMNSATITTTGGADDDTTGVGRGNNAGDVSLTSAAGVTSNTGVISALGGNGQDRGGEGADLLLMGVTVSNSANLAVDGGDATDTVTGSIGGDAGEIFFRSEMPSGISDSGTHTITGGTGEKEGFDGVLRNISSH